MHIVIFFNIQAAIIQLPYNLKSCERDHLSPFSQYLYYHGFLNESRNSNWTIFHAQGLIFIEFCLKAQQLVPVLRILL